MNEWISVKDRHAPPMETVILCISGEVYVGWNESVQSGEIASYCSWEKCLEPGFSIEDVTHWMPLPESPSEHL